MYNPKDHYFKVRGAGVLWSSRRESYVPESDAEFVEWLIAADDLAPGVAEYDSEAEMSSELNLRGLRGPLPSEACIRREVVRRQCALLGMQRPDEAELQRRILAGTREATELQNIKLKHLESPSEHPDWTAEQATWAAFLAYIEERLSEIEIAAEPLYATLPADYADDSKWPQ